MAGRLRELEGSGTAELVAALERQLSVQRTMERQLESFYDQVDASSSSSTQSAGRC